MATGMAAALRPTAEEPVPVLLMNTIWADRSGVHDALTSPEELTAWLGAVADRLPDPVGAGPEDVSQADVTAFRELRAALRRLAADATGDERARALEVLDARDPSWAADIVNAACAAAPPIPRLIWPGRAALRTVPAGARPPVVALSTVAATAVELFGKHADMVRTCPAPGCVLYFVKDHQRREWCSAACGNRARARRHYDRHRSR